MPTNGIVLKATGVNLSFDYGKKPVLRNVSFEVPNVTGRGQVFAILGGSGVGKSQLLNFIAGLQRELPGKQMDGKVEIYNRDSELVSVCVGMTGMVFQKSILFKHHTVLSNLVVAGRNAGMSREKATETAWQLLKEFDIEDCAHRYPVGDQISGGQRQRAAICQQAMCSDHCILMDEPFASLDPVATQKASERIKQFAGGHDLNTVVLVTHDITAACMVADTMIMLGRDRNPDGSFVPGAYVKREHDLIDRGLEWRKGITTDPKFAEFVREVREDFDQM